MTDATPWISALRVSHDRFTAVVRSLSADEVSAPSYDDEWTVADVASHLGSQAEIFARFLESGVGGAPAPGPEAFPSIWDRWNVTPPPEQVATSVHVNEAFVSRLESLSADERAGFALSLFGMDFDLAGFAAMRLSEHAVHTWDIEVALDPSATIGPDAVDLLIDSVRSTAGRSGRSVDGAAPVTIATTEPARSFLLTLAPTVGLAPITGTTDATGPADPVARPADLTMPAESLIRLVFGRLDSEHTPADVTGGPDRLDQLRGVFPGF